MPRLLNVFRVADPAPERDGVYKLLPPSLVSLQILFGLDIGFLRQPGIDHVGRNELIFDEHMNEQDLHHAECSTYHWLEEILDHKGAALPVLSRIQIIERACPWHWPHIDWQPPAELINMLLHHGVGMKALIKVPGTSCGASGDRQTWRARRGPS